MFAVQRDRGITQTHTEFNAPCRQLTLLNNQDLLTRHCQFLCRPQTLHHSSHKV